MYIALTLDCKFISTSYLSVSLFLPDKHRCTLALMQKILNGDKQVFINDEVRKINVPN